MDWVQSRKKQHELAPRLQYAFTMLFAMSPKRRHLFALQTVMLSDDAKRLTPSTTEMIACKGAPTSEATLSLDIWANAIAFVCPLFHYPLPPC